MKWYDYFFLCEPEIFVPLQGKSRTKTYEIVKPVKFCLNSVSHVDSKVQSQPSLFVSFMLGSIH